MAVNATAFTKDLDIWKRISEDPSLKSNDNEAGELLACLIIRALFSVIEFQSQLYVPRWLGACNLPHRRSQTHVGCVQLDVVESIDEVGSELQPDPLRKGEILVQTHVNIGVVRRTQSIKLR